MEPGQKVGHGQEVESKLVNGVEKEKSGPLSRAVPPPSVLITMLIAVLLLLGCGEVSYYWQAGMGQMEIIRKRQPIEEVLADDQEPELVKTKLRLVLRVRDFGQLMMALPQDGSYRYYADLERDQVTWLVVASQRFAMEEVSHCYPIVGCLGYRGYFDREDADAFAGKLAEQGYDVIVRPVRAYSTLGWFDDPVLNTYIRSSDMNLISTILHEQAHQVLFVKGDTAFNESFSTFVEQEGLRRFLSGMGSEGEALLARNSQRRKEQALFREIVVRWRGKLESLYADDLPEPEMLAGKARLFKEMGRDYQNRKNSFTILSYDQWFDQELNNAHLVGVKQYYSWVGAFRELFAREGADFPRFYKAAEALAGLAPKERTARLKALEEKTLARH